MDGNRFDLLAKRLATGGTSRRRLLRGLGAAGLTVGGGLLGTRATAAFICRQPGVLCAKDAQCCSGSCANDHCACPDGGLLCGRTCVDPASLDNCGACGNVCTTDVANAHPICTDGQCSSACNDGFLACGPACQACCTNADCAQLTDACNEGVCGPDGVCVKQPVADGTRCPASDACHTGACQQGLCQQTAIVCDDGDPCTTNSCDPTSGCVFSLVSCPVCQACSGGTCQPVDSDPRCTAPNSCGGGGTPGACGCTPDNATACAGAACGDVRTNNCGQQVSCDPCPYPRHCNTYTGQCVCLGGLPGCGSSDDCPTAILTDTICQETCCCTPNGPSHVNYGCNPFVDPEPRCCSGYCDPATFLCADRP